ncbi:MAG: DUF4340 domain-containing protein [Anaerolineales bacterium]|nr:DUF4340 domain-containing protein [Anaerolineales bacterium]
MLLLLAAIGAYYFVNQRKAEKESAAIAPKATEAPPIYLFEAQGAAPSSLRIEAQSGEIIELSRSTIDAWQLIQPTKAPADPAAAEAAASQITALLIKDTIPGLSLADAGLQNPQYIIAATFNGAEQTVKIGDVTPTESEYYALTPAGAVTTIDKASLDILLGLLTNLPYKETPTPAPTATETPLPSQTPETAVPTQPESTPEQ